LHAFNYGLHGEKNLDVFKKVVDAVEVPPFVPRSGVKVQINDSDPTPEIGELNLYFIVTLLILLLHKSRRIG
jgi:hypothetical protein